MDRGCALRLDGGAHACYITTLALQFGAIDPSAHADSVGQVSVTCTDAPGTLVRYSLSLSGGLAGDHRLVGSTVTKHYAVYGRIFGGQSVPIGVYGDSILISLDF